MEDWRVLKLLDALTRIAIALERQAEAQERIATTIEETELPETIDKQQAAKLLCVSPRTIERYHEHWLEGVHYFREGSRITYNRPLLQDWQANRANPLVHQRAIKKWLKTLPSYKSYKKGA
ncbi:hypothetical protein QGP82_23630 [Leptothoe sp. LEGE 181152]|nr:hypothetical protein [Leptothoe sp. LEGE 181152]